MLAMGFKISSEPSNLVGYILYLLSLIQNHDSIEFYLEKNILGTWKYVVLQTSTPRNKVLDPKSAIQTSIMLISCFVTQFFLLFMLKKAVNFPKKITEDHYVGKN